MRIPKKSEEVFRYAQSIESPWQLTVMAPIAVEKSITADTWFLSDEEWTARETADIPPSPSDADGEWE